MQPVTVEIVAYTPTEFFHCSHCELVWRQTGMGQKIHAEQRASALPPDLAQTYARIGALAAELLERYGGRIDLRVTDAASPQGFFKTLRYRISRFPAVVVNGKAYTADELDPIIQAVEREIGSSASPSARRERR